MAGRGSELREATGELPGVRGGRAQTQNRGAICLTDTQGERDSSEYIMNLKSSFDSERDRTGSACVCLV